MARSSIPSRDALQRLFDGLQTFIREHLALARVEIKEDLRTMGRDVLSGAAGVPALLTGYLLLMMAIAWLLAVWLPTWAAFAIVAVANLGSGGIVTLRAIRRVRADRISLPRTGSELERDREWIASMKESTGDGAAQAPRPRTLTSPGAEAR